MADFKLGRIRFVWKGEWTGPNTYYKDDVVRFGGKTFICLIGHTTSATFNDDLNANEPRWEQMSDGVTWKGNWAPQTVYGLNDIVKYGGMLYICSVGHTSDNDFIGGLENELGQDSSNPKWDLFCEGFDYLGTWVAETRYKLNDVVKYGAKTYICLEGHVAADVTGGILADADKWEVFSEGLEWQGDWQANTRYRQSEVVKYGGQVYVCNTEHTSAATAALGLEANQSNWDYLHQGIDYLSDWQPATRYKVNDVVKNGGGLWICTTHHTSGANDDLRQDESNWAEFLPGLEFEDTWDSATSYQSGDIVTYGGYTYIAITNNINVIPYNNTSDWDLFVTGFNLQGDYDNGTAYKTGDVVRLGGWTYIATADTTGNRPPNLTYWDKLNEGAYWKDAWADATYYDKGDVVRYGSNSYICIAEHTSDENPLVGNNRPDQDINGVNWNVISGGVESANLTTAGDIVYYGGSGPTRLPAGAPGQVLQVNPDGDAPIWSNFGYINHVYYVEPTTGVDEPPPGRGITIDRPYKSVRYACMQIEQGAAHRNARIMLEHNRSFIQAEVVEFVDNQIANNTPPFSSVFTYDKEKCRRDTGIIVDAITWDLSHGGNVRSRQAALEYFTEGGLSYIAGQEDETVAALNYSLVVMTAILSNLAPATNYQTLNGVGSPITQQIDGTLTADNESLSIVTNLLSIITGAITAGNTNSVPAELIAQKTVFVKTGETQEVSPIIVPESTAVVGDELRSARIGLADSLVDPGDAVYSLEGIARVKDIIGNIITNTPVSKTTTGDVPNNETQVTTRPAGSVGSLAAVTAIDAGADEMLDIIENGTANADAFSFSDTGVTAKTTARTELQTNRAAIIADLISWIGTNYPLLTYDQTKCERDTGYAIDAVSYDIQYGTNWATVIQARNYYDLDGNYVKPADQRAPTAAAMNQLAVIMADYMSGSTEEAEAVTLLGDLADVITNGIGNLPTITYPDITWATQGLQDANAAVLARKAETQTQAVSFVKANNSGFIFNETVCYRDSGYIVEALAYDMALGTNYQSVVAATSYYKGTTSSQEVINNQLDATLGAVRFIKHKTRLLAATGAAAKAETLMQEIYNYVDFKVNDNGSEPTYAGQNDPLTDTGHTYAVEVLEANKDFIAAEAVAYVHDQNPGITYSAEACKRDVKAYIDGIKQDLIYTGNYSSINAARVYSNSVNGSRDQDLFYLRNGTGLRNCTLFNATATLSNANQYGTQRPNGGAYTSLDPGWGPDHSAAWIKNKSPYVQNVTTFGDSCVGCKVDGNLHNGGNDSIVANDFTQILSDGIGYWVTNLGRAELVSVFCYYNHIGYLAENGGKIRATNGNNSYGAFGSVAEGIDETEVPVLGVVDNRQLEAQVGLTFTDGTDEILQLEYTYAGEGYTTASDAIIAMNAPSGGNDNTRTTGTYKNVSGTSNGSGTGQEFTIVVNEVGGVEIFEITKGGSGHSIGDTITFDASEIGGTGSGFTATISNIGDATRFTISGEGFGAIVNAAQIYDGGVKEVRLTNPSDNFGGEGYITIASNAQAGTPTQITLSATDVRPDDAYNGMAVYLTAGRGAGQYGYITDFNSGNKIATVSKMSDGTPGWDHVVPGTTIETFLDTTTAYDIAPRVEFSAPPSGLYADTARGRARVSDDQIVEVRITHPGQGYLAPPTMTVTDPNELVAVSYEVRIGDGVLGQPTWTNRGTGFVTASTQIVGDGFADIFQNGTRIRVDGLDDIPLPGSNVEFASIPNTWYKLVTLTSLIGNGPYSAILQVSPEIDVSDNLPHDDAITIRRRFSQVRLTGHDFLDIGTGNFTNTNYPGDPLQDPDPTKETNDNGGGRVFYTSTDQDGNFRVGGLFNVEQATGIATLNVEAFNISGLNELQLGSVALGGTGAIITEFSTDGTFAADSDSIVPTQKAIKTYITSQIGGGAATLNVNSLTAGVVEITGQQISTVDDSPLNINTSMTFNAPVDGAPIALQMFLLN